MRFHSKYKEWCQRHFFLIITIIIINIWIIHLQGSNSINCNQNNNMFILIHFLSAFFCHFNFLYSFRKINFWILHPFQICIQYHYNKIFVHKEIFLTKAYSFQILFNKATFHLIKSERDSSSHFSLNKQQLNC